MSIILFTLDETSVTRANWRRSPAHYPRAEARARLVVSTIAPKACAASASKRTETAGFYNTVGFNDDTRAFLSIPARHDVARRVDCAFLARLVAEHRMTDDEAVELIARSVVQSREEGVQIVRARASRLPLITQACEARSETATL